MEWTHTEQGKTCSWQDIVLHPLINDSVKGKEEKGAFLGNTQQKKCACSVGIGSERAKRRPRGGRSGSLPRE